MGTTETDPADGGRGYEVETARAYGDRLVLKLRGVDDPGSAAALKGLSVAAPGSEVPILPEGRYWVARLVGARVLDGAGEGLGVVEDVVETGGADLLLVRDPSGLEVLVPMAQDIVTEIDEDRGLVRVRLPEGLRELNAPEGRGGRTTA